MPATDVSDLYWLSKKENSSIFTYQWFIFIIIMVLGMQGGMTPMAGIFTLYKPEFACNTTQGEYALTEWSERCGKTKPVSCFVNNTNLGSRDKCDSGYIYVDDGKMPISLAEELNLVCDDSSSITIANTLMFFGYQVGSMAIGYIADNYGRRPAVIGSSLGHCFLNFLTVFCTSIHQYYLMKFLLGCFVMGTYLSAFLYMDEFLSKKQRSMGNAAYASAFGVGYGLVVLQAYETRHWTDVHKAIGVVAIPGTILAYFYFQESPSFLIANKKYKEAERVVKYFAEKNGKPGFDKIDLCKDLKLESGLEIQTVTGVSTSSAGQFNSSFTKMVESDGLPLGGTCDESADTSGTVIVEEIDDREKIYSTMDLFTNGNEMRFLTVSLMFTWFVCSLAYYGLSLGSAALPVDIYVTNWIFAAMDLPSCLLCHIGMNNVGRKKTLVWGLAVGGALILLSAILNEVTYCQQDTQSIFENKIIMGSFIANNIGRLTLTAAFVCVYKYTLELYPVCVRGNALGICSMASRTGAIVSPTFVHLGTVCSWLPGVTFGVMGILAGLFGNWYPETKGASVMLSIDEGKKFYNMKAAEKASVRSASIRM